MLEPRQVMSLDCLSSAFKSKVDLAFWLSRAQTLSPVSRKRGRPRIPERSIQDIRDRVSLISVPRIFRSRRRCDRRGWPRISPTLRGALASDPEPKAVGERSLGREVADMARARNPYRRGNARLVGRCPARLFQRGSIALSGFGAVRVGRGGDGYRQLERVSNVARSRADHPRNQRIFNLTWSASLFGAELHGDYPADGSCTPSCFGQD